jgi:phosphoribosylformylglycinamidine synthase PurS subunit
MRIRVYVTPRKGVLDPQGQAVASGLRSLGFDLVRDVKVGKVIDVELKGVHDESVALEEARKMARELLANEIVEDFDVAVL